tara:strand:+ start:392 stop:577 length:186 start_codon:yes stop_codon:yes gene_type:complete
MKKRIIAILFCIILLVPSCASSKPVIPKSESTVEKVVSKDPLMKLLASALIIYAIQILVTK